MLPKKPQRTYADNMLDLKIDSRNFDDFFFNCFFRVRSRCCLETSLFSPIDWLIIAS